MTPAQRAASAAELLNQIFASWEKENGRPADAIIGIYFKTNRYIGSKDRPIIATLVYEVLRRKAEMEWQASRLGFTNDAAGLVKTVQAVRDGKAHDMSSARATVRHNVPEWILPHLKESLGEEWEEEIAALNKEAPVDLRVNMLKAKSREDVIKKLKEEGLEASATALSPLGIRLKKRAAIFASPSFKQGLFEVQDEGSQLVALLCDAKPGMRVIDFCAGAGGKTLALAAAMKNKGKILALDTSEKRLAQMKPRLARAGVDNVELHVIENERDKFLKRHAESADMVLVDAPCSGTGTWRRNPDLKWKTTRKDLDELIDLQHRILEQASRLITQAGSLVYATCSLLNSENNQQVAKFLVDNANFGVVAVDKLWNKLSPSAPPGGDLLRLTPFKNGTDGFFAAVFKRV